MLPANLLWYLTLRSKKAITDWAKTGGTNYSGLSWLDGSTPRPAGFIHSSAMRQYAVTFIDNHDTDVSHTGGTWPLYRRC